MNRGIFILLAAIAIIGLAGLYVLQHGQALFTGRPPTDLIAFVSTRGGQTDIWTMKADGTDRHRITDDPAEDASPAWSPHGSEILSVSNREDARYEVYVSSWNGKYLKRLTNSAGTKDLPGWSPDGKEIVFLASGTVHIRSRFGGDDMQVIPTVEQGVTQFPRPYVSAKWSPNHRTLAVVEDADRGQVGTVREDFENPDRKPIPLAVAEYVDVAWAREGYRIATAFVGRKEKDRPSESGILVGDISSMKGGDILIMDGDTTGPGNPAWSPDGKLIAFELWQVRKRLREKSIGLYVIDAEGGKPRLLVKGEAMDPTWSSDGKYVAYTLPREDGKRDIWRIGIDGKGAVNLTGGEGDNSQPEWSPPPK